MKKRFLDVMHSIAVITIAVICITACTSSPERAAGVVVFEGATPSVAGPPIAPPTAGITQEPPGGGPAAYFFSNAKSAQGSSGHVELKLSRTRFINIARQDHLVFDFMVDNIELIDDIRGFYPRLFFGPGNREFTQFRATPEFQDILAAEQPQEGQWFTVRVPVGEVNIHDLAQNYSASKSSMCGLMIIFTTRSMDVVPGTWYVRNIRFEI